MIKFETYQSKTLSQLPTVKEMIGAGGKLGIVKKNFLDKSKRVVLLMKKADGSSAIVSCSEELSKNLRNRSVSLEQVLGFGGIENEKGIPFITMPATGVVEISSDITPEPFEVKSNLTLADLAA